MDDIKITPTGDDPTAGGTPQSGGNAEAPVPASFDLRFGDKSPEPQNVPGASQLIETAPSTPVIDLNVQSEPTLSATPEPVMTDVAPAPEAVMTDTAPAPDAVMTDVAPAPEVATTPSPVMAETVPAEAPKTEITPVVQVAPAPAAEPSFDLPTPSPELIEAATGEPQPLPEDLPQKSGLLKTSLIAGAILLVVIAAGATFIFGKGWPFKGQFVAPESPTHFSGAVVLCPTGYYAPKAAAFKPDTPNDLKLAKAQVMQYLDTELSAVDKAKDAAALVEKNNQAIRSVSDAVTGTSPATAPEQPGILMESATMEEQPGILMESATMPGTNGITDMPSTQVGTADVPPGCFPIPVDALGKGQEQCTLIDELYLDPAAYRLNEETKAQLEEWNLKCNPPAMVETKNTCGDNQQPALTTNKCICKEGFIDVSSIAIPGTNAVVALDTAAVAPVDTARNIVCWDCEMLQTGIDETRVKLEQATTLDEKMQIQEKINALEELAVRNGCSTATPVEVACSDNEVRDVSGACICQDGYFKETISGKCIDCPMLVKEIIALRENPTTSPDDTLTSALLVREREALANKCEVPVKELTQCEQYNENMKNAFNSGDYDTFYVNSQKFIDENCSGKTSDKCNSLLAKGAAVSKILQTATEGEVIGKYNAEMSSIKDSYYSDAICNNVERRCAQLEPVYGNQPAAVAPAGTTAPVGAGAPPSTNGVTNLPSESLNPAILNDNLTEIAITPDTIFNDDEEYYQKYCIKKELTCDEINRQYKPADLDKLDITATERARYLACMPVPEVKVLTCDEINRQYKLADLDKLDITDTERARYRSCMLIPEVIENPPPTIEQTQQTIEIRKPEMPVLQDRVVLTPPLPERPDIEPSVEPTPAPTSPTPPPAPTSPPPPPAAPTPPPAAPQVAPEPTVVVTPPPVQTVAASSGSGWTPPAATVTPAKTSSSPALVAPTPAAPSQVAKLASAPVLQPAAPTPAKTEKVVAESMTIEEPAAPAQAPVQPQAPVPAMHAAAPEQSVETPAMPSAAPQMVSGKVPPEITPTGPEVYIYIIAFLAAQAYIFRKRILAFAAK